MKINLQDFQSSMEKKEYLEKKIESKEFLSMGKSTPFDGKRVFGKCVMTIYGGKVVWSENLTEK